MTGMRRCTKSFFDRHHLEVARDLPGCHLFWDGLSGRIVETESYAVEGDPACHTATRRSASDFFCSNSPGTAYVYLNYGIHWMLNVLANDGIVLIRALQPISGIEIMQRRRGRTDLRELCSGPGKLGQALGLSGIDHGTSLMTQQRHIRRPGSLGAADRPRLASGPGQSANVESGNTVADVRVGLSVGLDREWRFLICDDSYVSVPVGKALSRRRVRRSVRIAGDEIDGE
jgi:DNA-3-methyladenine glycosylase